MDFDEFTSSLKKIFDYFQTRPVVVSIERLWFERVKNIPSGSPLAAIVSEIMDRDSLPRNIPKAYKTAWVTWMNANQTKIAQQRTDAKTKCDCCGGSGLIFSWGVDHGNRYSFVNRCRWCKNWVDQVSADSLPEYSKEQLCQKGFEVGR